MGKLGFIALPIVKRQPVKMSNNLGGSARLVGAITTDASTDEIPAGDLETTKAYAQRIAKMTKQFKG